MQPLRHALVVVVTAVLPLSLTLADTSTARAKTPAATKKSTIGKRKNPSPKTSSSRTGSARRGTSIAANRHTSRTRQLQPTPERYKEIQEALASKGYLSEEPSGSWNQQSVDALRRFQQDQNINPSGKIDSLSLIALGLGPKRTTTPASPPHPEPKAETPPAAANGFN